jgi:hypothetical protein
MPVPRIHHFNQVADRLVFVLASHNLILAEPAPR